MNGRRRLIELQEITDTESRGSEDAQSIRKYSISPFHRRAGARLRCQPSIGPVHTLVLDLPALGAEQPPVLSRLAVFADPWPGPMAVWSSSDGLSFSQAGLALAPSVAGQTLDDLPAGPTARWHLASFRVRLYGGALNRSPTPHCLRAPMRPRSSAPTARWEIVQFANAELVADRTYLCRGCCRGQAGSEWAMVRICRPAHRSCCSISIW